MLRRRSLGSGLTRRVDRAFRHFALLYRGALARVIRAPWLAVVSLLALTALAAWLMDRMPAEYAPPEDRGAFFVLLRAPEGASLSYMDRYARQMEEILAEEMDPGRAYRLLRRRAGLDRQEGPSGTGTGTGTGTNTDAATV